MNENNNYNLILEYPSSFPDLLIQKEINEFSLDNLKIAINKTEYGPFACVEWALPTIFVAYLIKPLFESFLNEMGKDGYLIFKESIKSFVIKRKESKSKIIVAHQSTEKLDKNYSQSHDISLIIFLKDDRKIKMLFDNDLSKDDWENTVDVLLDYVIKNYENEPNEKLTELISKYQPKPHQYIYGMINPKTKNIEFYDERSLIMKERQ